METLITLNGKAYSDNIADIIKLFGQIGWGMYNSKGMMEYLPVGDNEQYNWKCEKISEESLFQIISEKIARKELVGINLFYNGGTDGISLLAENPEEMILGLINRRIYKDKNTDIAWYIEHIIYKLLDHGVRLLHYKVEEFED